MFSSISGHAATESRRDLSAHTFFPVFFFFHIFPYRSGVFFSDYAHRNTVENMEYPTVCRWTFGWKFGVTAVSDLRLLRLHDYFHRSTFSSRFHDVIENIFLLLLLCLDEFRAIFFFFISLSRYILLIRVPALPILYH